MYICICNGITEREIVPEARNVLPKCAHAHRPASVEPMPRAAMGGDD